MDTQPESNTFMRWGRISLYGVALNFLGEGVISLIAPAKLTPLVEIAMPTRAAVMELRAVYGGFFFGTGLFLVLFARRDSWLRPGLIAQACIFGGFVLARALSIVVGDAPNLFIAALTIAEVIGLAVALVLLRGLDSDARLAAHPGITGRMGS